MRKFRIAGPNRSSSSSVNSLSSTIGLDDRSNGLDNVELKLEDSDDDDGDKVDDVDGNFNTASSSTRIDRLRSSLGRLTSACSRAPRIGAGAGLA
jgi:hypothetical protein